MTPPSERVAKTRLDATRSRHRAVAARPAARAAARARRARRGRARRGRARAAAERVARPARRARRRARARSRHARCSNGQARATSVATPYRIRCESHDGRWHERYDAYSFPLEIDDGDLARFARGSHIHAHRFLGAHERTIAGVRGIRFAVWAPNAERVSVVGTFNHWDGRYHPMSVRGSSGVWELFVPELRRRRALQVRDLHARQPRAEAQDRPLRRGVRAAARDGGHHDAAVDVRLGRRGVARAARAARLAQGADLDLRGAPGLVAPQRRRAAS